MAISMAGRSRYRIADYLVSELQAAVARLALHAWRGYTVYGVRGSFGNGRHFGRIFLYERMYGKQQRRRRVLHALRIHLQEKAVARCEEALHAWRVATGPAERAVTDAEELPYLPDFFFCLMGGIRLAA